MSATLPVTRDDLSVLAGAGSPETHAAFARLNTLAARLEHALDVLEPTITMAQQAPLMIATAVDTFDALVAEGRENGIDLDQRLRDGVVMLERLSNPDTMRALNVLLDRLPTLAALAPMVDQAPTLLERAQRDARPLGLFGTLGALSDPGVQRAVGLAVAAANLVGQHTTPARGGQTA